MLDKRKSRANCKEKIASLQLHKKEEKPSNGGWGVGLYGRTVEREIFRAREISGYCSGARCLQRFTKPYSAGR